MRESMQPPRAKQAIFAPQRQQLAEAGASATAGGDWEPFEGVVSAAPIFLISSIP